MALLISRMRLSASFQRYQWIQTWVTVRKPPIWFKIVDLMSCLPLKFDGWPWKQWGTASPLLQALCIISYTLKNSNRGNNPETPNLVQNRFLFRVTLIFDRLLWKTIRHLFHATSSFVHYFVAIGIFKLELQSLNAQFGSKSTRPWNLVDDLENQLDASHKQHQAMWIIAICEFKLELRPGNG